jgi:hypothetical protein
MSLPVLGGYPLQGGEAPKQAQGGDPLMKFENQNR